MLVLTNCVTTQLVALDLRRQGTVVYEGITGVVEDVTELKCAIEVLACDLVTPTPFTIDSFTTPISVLEVGASLVNPSFSVVYAAPPTLAELDDSEATPTKDVIATPTAFTSDGTFAKTANNDLVTFTLSAARGSLSDQSSVAISWQPKVHWGIAGGALLTETQIKGLIGEAFAPDYGRTLVVNAPGPTDYVWYCFPQSYDPTDSVQFQVGPFIGGFQKVGVVSVTNAYGVTQNYACWRSDFPALGPLTVVVF